MRAGVYQLTNFLTLSLVPTQESRGYDFVVAVVTLSTSSGRRPRPPRLPAHDCFKESREMLQDRVVHDEAR